MCWTCKTRRRTGRPTIPHDVRTLIRTMSQANPLWGASRIHGELLKLGIEICQATVAKYMVRPSAATVPDVARVPSEFGQLVAADFFVVPTATGRLLFVLVLGVLPVSLRESTRPELIPSVCQQINCQQRPLRSRHHLQ